VLVYYQGKSMTYRSDRELLGAISSLQFQIDAAQGVTRVKNTSLSARRLAGQQCRKRR
jgi:hypothetical protein